MMKHKKLLPAWLIILIDLLIIAAYTAGFYGLYYLTPRQLESTGVKTAQVETTSETSVSTSEETTDTSETTTSSDSTTSSESTTSETTTTSVDWATKFADKFTDTVVSTADTYTSEDISITVKKYTEGSGSNIVTYYVADIYIANIESFQTGFADDSYGVGYADEVLSMDESLSAILAMNGDYYGNGSTGVVIRNGEVYRSTTSSSDVCVLYYDGTMKTYSAEEFDVEQAIADGAWQAWCFGPELLDDTGSSMTEFTSDGHVAEINPRSALGYYEPGHYCMVVVDGRQSGYSVGMTLTQLSTLFEELGCTSAYNMDGGKSSSMTFDDTITNQPADGGREVSDCLLIKEVE
jgi:exopolysaccharide biosynthesis protein